MFNHHDITRNACMLHGALARHGYDWWWHSFTAQDAETGEDKPFFIEFYVCNPALAEDDPVLGQLPANQKAGKKPSYLMVKAGTWGEDACQLHRFFAWKDVNMHGDAPYQIEAADCMACETALKGKISVTPEEAAAHPEWMCDAGEMSWDISVDKQIAFNVGYGASKPLRDAEAFAMYWHAEGMKTAYSGNVTFNGREYTVTPERSYGYADKNWGRDFTTPWVWLSSNCLTGKKTGRRLQNSVFDIGGGRPKIYFVPLDRRLLGVFYYEGKEYDFNFSKLHLRVKTDFSFEEHDEEVIWHVRQENIHAAMETEVHCLKKNMLLINYEAPDGSRHHNRLWNGGNGWGTIKLYDRQNGQLIPIDEIEATHIGCEYGEYDHEKPYSGDGEFDYRLTDTGKETADQKEIIDTQLYSPERIERVKKYEKLYDEAVFSHDPEKLSALETYYASGEWMEDYEADERGELPPDLKRGVLSQDALYELLEEAKQ